MAYRDISTEVIGALFDPQPIFLYECGLQSNIGIIEIGSFQGLSACYFCQGIRDSGKNTTLYSIDPHLGNPEHRRNDPNFKSSLTSFQNNINRYGYNDLVEIIVDCSWNVASSLPDEMCDVLFIDGLHEYEAVKKDFEMYLPKVTSGGIIIIHDARTDNNTEWPGVCKAFQEIIKPNPQVHGFYNVDTMICCYKK